MATTPSCAAWRVTSKAPGLDFTDPVLNGLAQVTWNAPPVLPPSTPTATFKADVDPRAHRRRRVLSWTRRRRARRTGSASTASAYAGRPRLAEVELRGEPRRDRRCSRWPVSRRDYFFGLFLNDGYGEAAPRLSVRIRKNGDVNADGAVTAADRDTLRNAIGSCAGDTRFEPLADMDGDKCITQADYRVWYQALQHPVRTLMNFKPCRRRCAGVRLAGRHDRSCSHGLAHRRRSGEGR